MKSWLMAVLLVGLSTALVPTLSEAKRFGGGKSSGMQRSTPDKPAQNSPPPSQQATPSQATPATAATAAAAAPAAAAAKRSWMGPVAGLAAGLGLAALASHLGFGEGLANFMMLALLAVVAFVVIRMLMRRFGPAASGPRLATAGPGFAQAQTAAPAQRVEPLQRAAEPAATGTASSPAIGSALLTPLAVAGATAGGALGAQGAHSAAALPADFDKAGFERIAKMIFIRMQAANDSADLDDLRKFTTPELFASLKMDLLERGPAAQTTDVLDVQAEVLDLAEEDAQQIVSVQFKGRVREEAGAEPVDFDEVWHLVKPLDDSRSWAIAGVQQHV